MSSSSQSSEAEEEKIQEKPKVQKQQRSPTERPWKHRKKSQKESLEEKKAVLEEKIAKEKQAGLAGSRFKIKRSSIDLGRRHVAISGQKDHPAKIEEQGSQGSESAATVVERSTQAPVQPPTNGGGMSINEWRRFSKGGSSLEFPPNIEFYRNTLEKLESGEGRLPPTRPSMMDLVEGLKNRQKEAHRDSLFSLELFKEQNTEIIEGQQRILGKLRSQPRRSESGSSKVPYKFIKNF
uniref:Coiled-coil domain-containing protein 137 n=1 Tax=Meloidogyne hapla TaxID=6305 RepID=A0A1I8BN84_MELHA